jgi:hypothetical protein
MLSYKNTRFFFFISHTPTFFPVHSYLAKL